MAGRGMERARGGASGMVGEEDPPEEVGGEAVGRLPRELTRVGGSERST